MCSRLPPFCAPTRHVAGHHFSPKISITPVRFTGTRFTQHVDGILNTSDSLHLTQGLPPSCLTRQSQGREPGTYPTGPQK